MAGWANGREPQPNNGQLTQDMPVERQPEPEPDPDPERAARVRRLCAGLPGLRLPEPGPVSPDERVRWSDDVRHSTLPGRL